MSWDQAFTGYLASRLVTSTDRNLHPGIAEFNIAALIVTYLDYRFALGASIGYSYEINSPINVNNLPEGIKKILRLDESSSGDTAASLIEIARVAYTYLPSEEITRAKYIAKVAFEASSIT